MLTGIDDHVTSSTTSTIIVASLSLSPSVSSSVSSLLQLQSDEFSKFELDSRLISRLLKSLTTSLLGVVDALSGCQG